MTTFYFMNTFISPQFEVFIFVFLNCMTTFLFLFLFQFLDCCRNEGKRFKFLVEDVSVVFSGCKRPKYMQCSESLKYV